MDEQHDAADPRYMLGSGGWKATSEDYDDYLQDEKTQSHRDRDPSHPAVPMETQYRDLPPTMPALFERVMPAVPDDYPAKIFKPDAQTLEVVFYNDVDAEVSGENVDGSKSWNIYGTRIEDETIRRIADALIQIWGRGWVVRRKPDGRDAFGISRQRIIVRRLSHVDFKYADETPEDARKILHGLDVDADRYGDLDYYPKPPQEIRQRTSGWDEQSPPCPTPMDVYVHRTSTGTCHLIRGSLLRGTGVTEPVECMCGRSVGSEAVRDGEVFHFADYIRRFTQTDVAALDTSSSSDDVTPSVTRGYIPTWNPIQVLRTALCDSCAKSYCDVRRDVDGRIRRYTILGVDYAQLTGWSVRPDALQWEPERIDPDGDDETAEVEA